LSSPLLANDLLVFKAYKINFSLTTPKPSTIEGLFGPKTPMETTKGIFGPRTQVVAIGVSWVKTPLIAKSF